MVYQETLNRNGVVFNRSRAERLSVSKDVIGVMMTLQETEDERRRRKLIDSLNECKARIVATLEDGDLDADDIPWNSSPFQLLETCQSRTLAQFSSVFSMPESDEKIQRQKEQCETLTVIDEYIRMCKEKAEDMSELVDWMTNFSYELSWEEIGLRPVEEREKEHAMSYKAMVVAMQRAFQCVRKLAQLVDNLLIDDKYDVLSGKLPAHIAAARVKKKGAAIPNLWCSQKMLFAFKSYEALRKKLPTEEQVDYEIKQPGQMMSPLRETESIILKEISRSWKEAVGDVVYYMQETARGKFSKPSCRKRLARAHLLLNFITAAIEGKLEEAARTESKLRDTEHNVIKLQDEAAQMQKELNENQKTITAARRKISRLKKQVEVFQEQHDIQTTRIGKLKDQIEGMKKEIEELSELPNQADLEESQRRVDELEAETQRTEIELSDLREELLSYTNQCTALKSKLAKEVEMKKTLMEDIELLEQENASVSVKMAKAEKKVSSQESNLMSLKLMVYYKDEVIRRLKQAAIELKTAERPLSSPKRPPPSPDEDDPKRKSNESLPQKENPKTGKQRTKPEKAKSTHEEAPKPVPTTPTAPVVKEPKQEIDVRIPTQQEAIDSNKSVLSTQTNDSINFIDSTNVGERLYSKAKTKPEPEQKSMKVFMVTDDVKELQEKHESAMRETNKIKKELRKIQKDFDFKLRKGLQSEKHKAVLESMKNEEELQDLCFSVRDETMKVQKEMRNFKEKMSYELNKLIGQDISKNAKKDKMGVVTANKLGFGDEKLEYDYTKLNMSGFGMEGGMRNMFGMDGGMPGEFGMMGGAEMLGGIGPPIGMDMGMGSPMSMGGPMGIGSPMGSFNMAGSEMTSGYNSQISQQNSQENNKPDGPPINYWKSLKTVIGGKPPKDKKEARKESEEMTDVSKIIAERRKQRQAKLDAAAAEEEKTSESQSSFQSSMDLSPKPSAALSGSLTRLSEAIKVKRLGVDSDEPISGVPRLAERRMSMGVQHLKDVIERKKANMGGERRNSVVVPFIPRRLSLAGNRRPSIIPTPPPSIKIRGFFGLPPAPPDPPKQPEPIVRKRPPRGPDDLSPLTETQMFIRMMSDQVSEFLNTMSQSLLTAVAHHKAEAAKQIEDMESIMQQERVKHLGQIAEIRNDRDMKERQIEEAQEFLNTVGVTRDTLGSSLPRDLIRRLQEAEDELDHAREHLVDAARFHVKQADEYRDKTIGFETRLKVAEEERKKQEKLLKKERETSYRLKQQIHKVQLSATQRLFLSSKEHGDNIKHIKYNKHIKDNVKKVAVNLLNRSKLMPAQNFYLLVQQYCQHVRFMTLQENLRQRIATEHKNGHQSKDLKHLTNLLAGVEMKKNLAKQRFNIRKQKLAKDRQKIFVKMSLLFHRLKVECRDIQIIHPTILTVSGRGYEPTHNNTPVERCSQLNALLPECRSHLSNTNLTSNGKKKSSTILPEIRKPPVDSSRNQSAAKLWRPDESVFCPFVNRNGSIAPMNSHMSFSNKRVSNKQYISKDHVVVDPQHYVVYPRILELEIQSGVHQAKRAIMSHSMWSEERSLSSSDWWKDISPLQQNSSTNPPNSSPTSISRPLTTPVSQLLNSQPTSSTFGFFKSDPDGDGDVIVNRITPTPSISSSSQSNRSEN